MALSGTISGSTSNKYIACQLIWRATNNTAGNYSDITATWQFRRTNSGYTTYGTGNFRINIDGDSTWVQPRVSIGTSWVTVQTKSKRVYHNNDGTRSCYIGADGGISGTSLGSSYAGQTVNLDTIPRASGMSLSTSTIAAGGSFTVNISPHSSGFSHWIDITGVGDQITYEVAAGVTSCTCTIPKERVTTFPNSQSAQATVYLNTKTGSGHDTKIGVVSQAITVTVPSDVKPSIGSVTLADATKAYSVLGAYAAGFSQVTATVPASVYHTDFTDTATIKSVTAVYNNTTYNAASGAYTRIEVSASDGFAFKNGTGTTTLTAAVYRGAEDITDTRIVKWFKDGDLIATGTSVTIDAKDISGKAVITVNAYAPEENLLSGWDTPNNGKDPQGYPVGQYDLTSKVVSGKTYIWSVKIKTGADGDQSKLAMYFGGGSYGTDWISTTPSTEQTITGTFTATDDMAAAAFVRVYYRNVFAKYGNTGYCLVEWAKLVADTSEPEVIKTVDVLNVTDVSKVTPEYYLSTSNTAQSGGSWTETPAEYVEGRYYWTRTKTTYSDGTTRYSTPVCVQSASGSFSFVPQAVGTANMTITATDSRGMTTSVTKAITVKAYTQPTVSVNASRCTASGAADDTGAYATVSLPAVIDSTNVSGNSAAVNLQYRPVGSTSSWTSVSVGTITKTQTLTKLISASDTQAFDLIATITDKITSNSAAMTLSNAQVPLDFLKGGKGISIGKTATREGLDIAFPTYVEGDKVYVDEKTILDKFFPIGKMWISTDPTSPASLFGGSWEQIQDRFLLACGSTYAAGKTGGEATHKLTVNEMPNHNHDNGAGFTWKAMVTSNSPIATPWNQKAALYHESYNSTGSTGGNGSHNNMPPYLAVYMWKRVA